MSRASQEIPDVSVVGATGYAGALAARLIDGHPGLGLAAVTSREDSGKPLREIAPESELTAELESFDADSIAERSDAVIVGYPHGAAAPVVAELRQRGLPVVDLSGDDRLSAERYERYYGGQAIPELLAEAVYGLTELYRDEISEAELVANPGCYATAAILALAPLREYLTEVVIDGKSGVSGAGRNAVVAPDARPYDVSGHPHLGELRQELGEDIPITFTPHLLPEHQGLLVSCYVTPNTELTQAEVDDLFHEAYFGEPFVHFGGELPGINEVRRTNVGRIAARVDPESGKILVFSAIDNLWKGAAGQALQNLNLMLGLEETAGLRAGR